MDIDIFTNNERVGMVVKAHTKRSLLDALKNHTHDEAVSVLKGQREAIDELIDELENSTLVELLERELYPDDYLKLVAVKNALQTLSVGEIVQRIAQLEGGDKCQQ